MERTITQETDRISSIIITLPSSENSKLVGQVSWVTIAGVVGPVSKANIWWVVMPTGVTEILFWSGRLSVAIQRND